MIRFLTLLFLTFPTLALAQPNILVVVADDMDWATFHATPGLDELAAQGITFNAAIAQTPLCGPSRASILTGKYTHNHGIKGNRTDLYNQRWYDTVLGNTFADWCKAGGYRTTMIGKYENVFDNQNHTGWDAWFPIVGRGEEQTGEFWHTTMLNQAIADISQHSNIPQLIWYSSSLPHKPLIPDNQYAGSLSGLHAPRTPNFNEEDVTDKVADVSDLTLIDSESEHMIDRRFRLRAELSRSLVDGINQLSEVLNPLYVIFISDNGYLQGNHRFRQGKGQPYEESIRVPMFVTGPNIAPAVSSAMVQASDLAPTIAELCGVQPPVTDSTSIVPLLSNPSLPWRNRVLIQNGWKGLVTPYRKLIRYASGKTELFRLDLDPYELQNLGTVPAMMNNQIDWLLNCEGSECQDIEFD